MYEATAVADPIVECVRVSKRFLIIVVVCEQYLFVPYGTHIFRFVSFWRECV